MCIRHVNLMNCLLFATWQLSKHLKSLIQNSKFIYDGSVWKRGKSKLLLLRCSICSYKVAHGAPANKVADTVVHFKKLETEWNVTFDKGHSQNDAVVRLSANVAAVSFPGRRLLVQGKRK